MYIFLLTQLLSLQSVRVGGSPTGGTTNEWAEALMDYTRRHDTEVLSQCDGLLRSFEEQLLPCQSIRELFDVAGALF